MCSYGNTVEEIIKFVTYLKTEEVRFELTEVLPSTVFKTVAINHSTTLPSDGIIILCIRFYVKCTLNRQKKELSLKEF